MFTIIKIRYRKLFLIIYINALNSHKLGEKKVISLFKNVKTPYFNGGEEYGKKAILSFTSSYRI